MKNYNLLVIALLLSTYIQAQEKFNFGLHFGGTSTTVRGNPEAEKNDASINFLVGLSFELKLNENSSLITNLNYERKSFKRKLQAAEFIDSGFDPSIGGQAITAKTNLSYFTIPFMYKYSFGNQKNFYVNGGPFVSIFLNSKAKIEGGGVDNEGSVDELFQPADFGLTFGLGTNFKLDEKNKLFIELRNNLGLMNTSKITIIDDGSLKTNALNLILGWTFM